MTVHVTTAFMQGDDRTTLVSYIRRRESLSERGGHINYKTVFIPLTVDAGLNVTCRGILEF